MEDVFKPGFTSLINLASEKLGALALSCTDDFFAPMENLLKPGRGIFVEGKYTEHGKWMDGWESRRKREAGHDWCVIKLGAQGIIKGVDVDTNHFLGNHPPFCSIEAALVSDDIETAQWMTILHKSPLNPGAQHYHEIHDNNIYSHVRLNIYPDGGVARLKIYGEVKKDWSQVDSDTLLDLAAATNGAKSIQCNDMFFSHMDNLLMPGRGSDMGDGWETKRNRTPGNVDWVIIRLACAGIIKKVCVDTYHFKGNYPDSCKIDVCNSLDENLSKAEWQPLLSETKLSAHKEHTFEEELMKTTSCTHAKLSIMPDGGISRLRLWGYKSNV